MAGHIVLLNGEPRSGKSSIAHAMQAGLDGVWVNLGVDLALASLPKSARPGIGLRPGGERPDLEPLVLAQFRALFDSIAAHSRAGLNVVVDIGIHDGYSQPLGILNEAVTRLRDLPVLFVGVRCPIDIIMARRNADSQGIYETGDTPPPTVLRWEAVHRPGVYDVEVDSSVTAPEDAVDVIRTLLQRAPIPSAFERLRDALHSD